MAVCGIPALPENRGLRSRRLSILMTQAPAMRPGRRADTFVRGGVCLSSAGYCWRPTLYTHGGSLTPSLDARLITVVRHLPVS
jgi:hypothetical protein